MNTKELNEYIKNYLEHDKTQSAIMLTAPWGTGKSYYIKNNLCPFLKDNGLNYALVSLYGLKNLEELSKNLYIEIRLSLLNKKFETVAAVKIAGKTIVKGIASFFNIDLSKNDEDWQKLYESIDLTNRLIIFEDLERSSLDIIEFMGYVNNLCEQDNVKVLLVANEEEIIRKEQERKNTNYSIEVLKTLEKEKTTENSQIKISSDIPIEYKIIKEKTVCDTIPFYIGFNEPIKQIMTSFNNKIFDKFLEENNNIVNEIIDIMNRVKSFNLRSFIYACQKTVEIFSWSEKELNIEFLKKIFYSNIAFCLRLKNNCNLDWTDNSQLSIELSVQEFPLYKFCFDYIKNYIVDKNALIVANTNYEKDILVKQENKKLNEVLQSIYRYYDLSENEVNTSIKNLYNYLKKSPIPISKYGQLSHFLVYIKGILDDNTDIDKCLQKMLEYIKDGNEYQESDFEFYMIPDSDLKNDEQENLYLKFKNDVLKNIKIVNKNKIKFDYSIENFDKFIDNIEKNQDSYLNQHEFASLLDIESFISLIEKCSSKQIRQIRIAFGGVYYFSNLYDYFSKDLNNLKIIKEKLESIKDTNKFDRIQKKQLELFIANIEQYINIIDRK